MSWVKKLKSLKPWVGLVMAFAIIGSLIGEILNEELLQKLLALPNLAWIILLAPSIFLFKALTWNQLTKSLQISIPFSKTMEAYALSNLGRYIPGKIFFVLGRIEAYGPDKQKLGTASFGMFIEFVIEFSSNFVLLLLCCLFTQYLSGYKLPLIVLASISLLASLTPYTYQKFYQLLHHRFPNWLTQPQLSWNIALIPITLNLISWSCFLACIYFFIQAWLPIQITDLFYIGVCLGFSSIIGTLAIFSPGGLGVREGIFTACLSSLGLSLEEAWTVASLTRVCQWYGELSFSTISFLASSRLGKN